MFQRKLMAVLSLAAVVALTGESQASLSRVEGMGLSVPTLSQFTDDYVNIYYYPASVVRQNNLVLAELGNNPSGLSDTGVFLQARSRRPSRASRSSGTSRASAQSPSR